MKVTLKIILALLLVLGVASAISPAMAIKPVNTGLKYPPGDPTGMVVGRVTPSDDNATGLAGAYVAIVNAYDLSQEYCNTTSDASGKYSFSGVNVTGNANAYKVYVRYGQSEGYSDPFDAIANTLASEDVAIDVPEPTPTQAPTATPAAGSPTPTAIASDLPAPTLAPKPSPTVPAITAMLVIGFVAYCVRKNRRK